MWVLLNFIAFYFVIAIDLISQYQNKTLRNIYQGVKIDPDLGENTQ